MKLTIYDIIERLWTLNLYVSEDKDLSELKLPEEFEDLWKILFSHLELKGIPEFIKCEYETFHYRQESYKRVTVCFSGGLKSLATACFYNNAGYYVDLYYMNKHDGTAENYVRYMAKQLDMELAVDGYCEPRGPLDDLIIAANAIAHFNHPFVAVGCYASSDLSGNDFEKYGSNTREMWEAFAKIIQPEFNIKFSIQTPLPNSHIMLDNITAYGQGLLALRGLQSDENLVYIIKADMGIRHKTSGKKYLSCVENLKNEWEENTGETYDTLRDFWESCFFYNIRKSKYYEKLKSL